MKTGAPMCMKCYSRMCRVENGKACRRRVDERIEREALASFAESRRTAAPAVYDPVEPTPEMIARFDRAEDDASDRKEDIVNVIRKDSDGYMVYRESGATGSGPSWGPTLSVALGRHYGGDRRHIPRPEQDRAARLYREACAPK